MSFEQNSEETVDAFVSKKGVYVAPQGPR